MNGVSEHQLSIKKLFAVLKTYEHLGLIPDGYNYAELYSRETEPNHMFQLRKRIEKHKKNEDS